jgi:type I restriction enzyme S subunit
VIAELRPYADYCQSVVAWIGKIPSHWIERRGKTLFRKMNRPVQIGDDVVTCFRDGVVTLRKKRRVTGFTNAILEIGYQGIRKGDLVIHAMDAFAGAIGVSDSDGKGTPVYSVCELKTNANSKYFALVTREMARNKWIVALSRGIRERSTDFRFDMFGSQFLPVPPPDEQELIVRFLDWASVRLGKAIAAKRKVIGLLEEQKQAIIHRAVTRGLDDSVPLKPSGIAWLGDVPEHWEVWRISRFAKVGNGSTPSRAKPLYWRNGSIPWLNSSQVNRGSIDSADQFVTKLALSECHLPIVKRNSLLVAITGQGKTRGMAALLRFESAINQHVAYITPRLPVAKIEFLQLAFAASYKELRRLSDDSGSTKGALTCEDLKRFKVSLPPPSEQAIIVRDVAYKTEAASKQIWIIAREIQLLLEYRTRLISDVVTGKLDVREFARTLPADVAEEAAELASSELDDEFSDTDDELDDELAGEPA